MSRRRNTEAAAVVVLLGCALSLAGCASTGESGTLQTPEAARPHVAWSFERSAAPQPTRAPRETPRLNDVIAAMSSSVGARTVPVSLRGATVFGAPFDCKPGHAGAAAPGAAPHAKSGDEAKPAGKVDAHGHDMASLAKQSQNPIADLINVPFEYMMNFDAGYRDNTLQVLQIKPVVPQKLSDDLLWIHRGIFKFTDQPKLSPESYSRSGMGDTTYQGFLVPTKMGVKVGETGHLTWGVGPQIGLPTATDDVLGSDNWTAGPSILGVLNDGPWVVGSLFANAWTFAQNDSDRERSRAFSWQPFINYNIPNGNGWYLTTDPVISANWNSEKAGDRWTVPVGVGIGRVFHIGAQPINVSIKPYYNVHRPNDAARWQLVFQVSFLFPE